MTTAPHLDHHYFFFVGHMSFSWGHWYPCFVLLVTSALGGFTDTPVLDFWWHLPWVSKPGWIPSLACFLTCAQQIPQIHLWCDTCLFHQYGCTLYKHVYGMAVARLLSHASGFEPPMQWWAAQWCVTKSDALPTKLSCRPSLLTDHNWLAARRCGEDIFLAVHGFWQTGWVKDKENNTIIAK